MDLKELRKRAGLTQQEAAVAFGSSRSTIDRIENGRTKRLDHDLIQRLRAGYEARIYQAV